MKVYLLEHVYINEHGTPDVHTIGVYATEAAARESGQKSGLKETTKTWPDKWESLCYFHIREAEVQE